MKTSPVDLSFVIPDKGVAKKAAAPFFSHRENHFDYRNTTKKLYITSDAVRASG
jgi:hypothetical protein